METADVLIVGGGPAGSSCAWKLRQLGIEALVLDKAEFPRHKVCAGWITPPIIEALQIDAADYRTSRTLQPITRFLTGMIDGREVDTDYGQTVSYGIRRCEFDDYLLRRSGGRLILGEPFRSMRREGSQWIVNERYCCPVIVGAGGHFCPVARHLESSPEESPSGNPAQPGEPSSLPVVVAQEVEFELTLAQQSVCTIQGDRPELFFCPDLKGYGWVFRKGSYLNVGMGREGEAHLSNHVGQFVEFLRRRGKVTFPLPTKFQGHAYRLRTQTPRPASAPGVVLIGDAIGLADRQSGEGIRPAIESGLICAATIAETGVTEREQIAAAYQARLTEQFNLKPPSSMATWLPDALRLFVARHLMASRWFTRRIVLDTWFLHR